MRLWEATHTVTTVTHRPAIIRRLPPRIAHRIRRIHRPRQLTVHRIRPIPPRAHPPRHPPPTCRPGSGCRALKNTGWMYWLKQNTLCWIDNRAVLLEVNELTMIYLQQLTSVSPQLSNIETLWFPKRQIRHITLASSPRNETTKTRTAMRRRHKQCSHWPGNKKGF